MKILNNSGGFILQDKQGNIHLANKDFLEKNGLQNPIQFDGLHKIIDMYILSNKNILVLDIKGNAYIIKRENKKFNINKIGRKINKIFYFLHRLPNKFYLYQDKSIISRICYEDGDKIDQYNFSSKIIKIFKQHIVLKNHKIYRFNPIQYMYDKRQQCVPTYKIKNINDIVLIDHNIFYITNKGIYTGEESIWSNFDNKKCVKININHKENMYAKTYFNTIGIFVDKLTGNNTVMNMKYSNQRLKCVKNEHLTKCIKSFKYNSGIEPGGKDYIIIYNKCKIFFCHKFFEYGTKQYTSDNYKEHNFNNLIYKYKNQKICQKLKFNKNIISIYECHDAIKIMFDDLTICSVSLSISPRVNIVNYYKLDIVFSPISLVQICIDKIRLWKRILNKNTKILPKNIRTIL